MSDPTKMDKTFLIIMKKLVETGQAPHYTEVAAELGISTEEGRKAVHELFSLPMFPGWLYPNTDFITSFPPFNHLPTQYRITVDGHQKWFGQWGFESLAVSWLFPGKTVRIDAPCLDCGEPIRVEMKDGVVQGTEPGSLVAYTCVPFREWFKDIPYSWSTMNLFRSEEDVRNWAGFKPGTEEGIVPVLDMAKAFSGDFFRKRLEPDYVSHMREYMIDLVKALRSRGSFWQLPRW
jgi:hypothetical protein